MQPGKSPATPTVQISTKKSTKRRGGLIREREKRICDHLFLLMHVVPEGDDVVEQYSEYNVIAFHFARVLTRNCEDFFIIMDSHDFCQCRSTIVSDSVACVSTFQHSIP